MLLPNHFARSIMETALHRKKVVRQVRGRPAEEEEASCTKYYSIKVEKNILFLKLISSDLTMEQWISAVSRVSLYMKPVTSQKITLSWLRLIRGN